MSTPKIAIVIGSNYGDEGKGAAVWEAACDMIRNDMAPMVLRTNGGHNAGHTVQTRLEDGTVIRHVHSSYGSAALLGCRTGYSDLGIISPSAILREGRALRKHLVKMGFHEVQIAETLQIMADNHTMVCSPFDVALNQFRELKLKHGSVGVGIGETVRRNESLPFSAMRLFQGDRSLQSKLAELEEYFRKEISALKLCDGIEIVPAISSEANLNALCEFIKESFMAEVKAVIEEDFLACGSYSWPDEADGWIFEGAQGLLLDQDDKDHSPHVTWSVTGSTNPLEVMTEQFGLVPSDEVEVHYCTRPYLTRHGNGPMLAGIGDPVSDPKILGLVNFEDKTNVPNQWQGSMRFQTMDWSALLRRINADFAHVKDKFPKARNYMSLICGDHLGKSLSDVMALVATISEETSSNRWPIIQNDGRDLRIPTQLFTTA